MKFNFSNGICLNEDPSLVRAGLSTENARPKSFTNNCGKRNGASQVQCFIFLSNDLWSTHSVESIVSETSMNSPNMEDILYSRWLRIWTFLNCSQLLLSVATSTKKLSRNEGQDGWNYFVYCALHIEPMFLYIFARATSSSKCNFYSKSHSS